MKPTLRILAKFAVIATLFLLIELVVINLYVPAAQAQDIIEKVTETQDSTAEFLRTPSALSTISSDAVEIKTENTQLSVEQGNQDRNKDLACNNKNFTSSIGGGFLSNTPF
ncbi:hypothetical protein QUB37_21650 [Microcoleus sp. AT3-A2]|uniref:hypothetical protein n=1 Tax=unclassified Microcoleus TaxID=2642155 RepID=UPI002FD1F871